MNGILRLPPNCAESTGNSTPFGISYLRKQELNLQISGIDVELQAYDRDIRKLQDLRISRVAKRDTLLKERRQLQSGPIWAKGKGKASEEGTDYTMDGFDWSQELRVRMKRIFGINNFRLCQQG
jgi:ATP-dependent DNA helicase Q1